jgi:transcriptional regulator with XRE-family HTH domain
MGDQIEKQLGKRVARFRRVAGLTQAQLAEMVGLASESVSRLERGATIPSIARLDDLAKALGVGMADLFEPEPKTTARNAAIADLLASLKRRSPEDVEFIRDLADRVLAYRSGASASKKR